MFVKSPEKGKVKSRLAASIGKKSALHLYKCFVDDLLLMLRKGGYPFIICFYPADAGRYIEKWLGKGYAFVPQTEGDLGERMKNAFNKAFSEGFESVLLIGSDIPDLPNRFIDEAFAALRSHDAVIGPSLDGGYYLIGFKKSAFIPSVFQGIAWGTQDVFACTMDIFIRLDCLPYILPQWMDVDTLDDLKALYHNNINNDFAASATMQYLQKENEVIS